MNRDDVRASRQGRRPGKRDDTQSMRRPAVAVRAIAVGTVCTVMCACGGGGGGASDDTGAVPPPQKTELSWDNGNWDQQEWK